jgi:hypothetical protein
MTGLLAVFIALTVFGAGVTIIDFFGLLEHGDANSDAHDGELGLAGHDIGADHGATDHGDFADHGAADHESVLSPGEKHPTQTGETGVKVVARALSTLRLLVYFALGAGPGGLAAVLTHHSLVSSLLWAAGIGVFVAVLARLLRRFIRRDLDSTIHSDELLMENAVLTLPLEPGALGKAIVRQYGREEEVVIKANDPKLRLEKGAAVTITGADGSVYYIEKTE